MQLQLTTDTDVTVMLNLQIYGPLFYRVSMQEEEKLLRPQPNAKSFPFPPTEGKPDPEFVRLGSVVAKLACTMTLGVVHYMSCNKLAWHLANTQQQDRQMQQQEEEEDAAAGKRHKQPWEKKGVLSWAAEFAIYCWQLLSIGEWTQKAKIS